MKTHVGVLGGFGFFFGLLGFFWVFGFFVLVLVFFLMLEQIILKMTKIRKPRLYILHFPTEKRISIDTIA